MNEENTDSITSSFTTDRYASRNLMEDHADELSGGAYVKAIAISLLKSAVTLGVGAGAFFLAKKHAPESIEKLVEKASENTKFETTETKTVIGWVAAIPAAITASSLMHYDKWKEAKSKGIAVQEINEDISGALRVHQLSDEDLLIENKRLRNMLEEKTELNDRLETQEPPPENHIKAKTTTHNNARIESTPEQIAQS